MQVIGVGLGRTGTLSLKHALNTLGYTTFHTDEMLFHREIFDMFFRKVYSHPPPADMEQLQPDFELVAKYYDAAVDMPLAPYYSQLKKKYPNAKFILTTRSSPEAWAASWMVLLGDSMSLLPRFVPWMYNVGKIDRYNRWLDAWLHGDERFLTLPHPLPQDAARLAQAYANHAAAVRREFADSPPHNFLDYRVSQGWEPLCAFLDKPVPANQPFPHVNTATSVVWRLRLGVLALNAILALFIGMTVWFLVRVTKARIWKAKQN